MYQAHFGLKRSLFESGIAKEESVFIGPRQQLVVANFKVAFTTLDSAIVLSGAPGIGKTTLAAAALRATTTRLALGWLGSAPANGTELTESLLAEFGFNPHRIGRVERLQMWRQFLNEMQATDTRVFIVAERADQLDIEVLRTLDAITAADPNGCAGANLVLLGQPQLIERLKLPELAPLKQRVRLRQRLEPFTVEELEAYLRHRVELAGGSFENVFERGTVAVLHQYSAGVARILNNLCETALTLAATGAEKRLSPALVMRIAIGLYGLDGDLPAGSAVAPIAASVAPTAAVPVAGVAPTTAAAPKAAQAAQAAPAAPHEAQAVEPLRSQRTTTVAPATENRAEQRRPSATASVTARSVELDVPVLTDAIEASPDRAAKSVEPRQSAQANVIATAPAHEPQADESDLDISMAETLFEDADLDMLSAALASAGWDDDEKQADELLDDLARTVAGDDSLTMETPQSTYSAFGALTENALELIDEPTAPVDARRGKTATPR